MSTSTKFDCDYCRFSGGDVVPINTFTGEPPGNYAKKTGHPLFTYTIYWKKT